MKVNMTYQIDSRGDIRDQHLRGESVVLSDDEHIASGLVDCVFESGVLTLAGRSAQWVPIILRTTVTDSEVIAKVPVKNKRFFKTRFINCRFRGAFQSIKFGRGFRPELYEDFGTIEGCDFTDAVLDDCEFVNVDVSTIKFPLRDHVVLLEPYKRAGDVAKVKWPGNMARYMALCTEPEEWLKAVVAHIPPLARQLNCTPEELRRAFEQFGGVLM